MGVNAACHLLLREEPFYTGCHLAVLAQKAPMRRDVLLYFATRFPSRIERAIADCGVFVCILGSETLQSPYVRRELAVAAELGKPMIPVFQESYVAPAED